MREAYRVLIGSIGDDIHSVGMALLTLAFREVGWVARNIGILNQLDDFFHLAGEHDVIMISVNNGHAGLYLDGFARKLAAYKLGDATPRLWYLGGNLSVSGDAEDIKKKYLQMGFDFVAPKPVTLEVIMDNLQGDLHRHGINKKPVSDRAEDEFPGPGESGAGHRRTDVGRRIRNHARSRPAVVEDRERCADRRRQEEPFGSGQESAQRDRRPTAKRRRSASAAPHRGGPCQRRDRTAAVPEKVWARRFVDPARRRQPEEHVRPGRRRGSSHREGEEIVPQRLPGAGPRRAGGRADRPGYRDAVPDQSRFARPPSGLRNRPGRRRQLARGRLHVLPLPVRQAALPGGQSQKLEICRQADRPLPPAYTISSSIASSSVR